ncbi:MAG: nitroreductase family protein [Candidatus Bathyarchaeota archaeon]|nr:MAG: nitroreductase family protein [Candidatus Bathyarchaeota archaeon]
MITVDNDKCTRCSLCAKICHEHCIALTDETLNIDYGLCSTCTQCIAVCPEQALTWNGASPTAFDKARLPSPEQLDELLKERRTIRFMKKDKIPRALLEEIVSYGIYAPTNNFNLRAVLVDNEETIEELDRIILQYVSKTYNLICKSKTIFNLIRKVTPALDPKDKVKMENSLKHGRIFLSPPVAIVFIIGDKRIALSSASAQYTLYNMILYAQTKGVGTRLWGAAEIFLDRDKTARRLLGLQRHEHILGALTLGYASITFRNKVKGKTLPIQWIPT